MNEDSEPVVGNYMPKFTQLDELGVRKQSRLCLIPITQVGIMCDNRE